jgi:hypothetical protein
MFKIKETCDIDDIVKYRSTDKNFAGLRIWMSPGDEHRLVYDLTGSPIIVLHRSETEMLQMMFNMNITLGILANGLHYALYRNQRPGFIRYPRANEFVNDKALLCDVVCLMNVYRLLKDLKIDCLVKGHQ